MQTNFYFRIIESLICIVILQCVKYTECNTYPPAFILIISTNWQRIKFNLFPTIIHLIAIEFSIKLHLETQTTK